MANGFVPKSLNFKLVLTIFISTNTVDILINIYNLVLFSMLLSDIHHVRVWLSVVLLLSLQHEQLHTCGDDNFFSSLVTLKHNFFVWIVQAFFDPQWTDLMVRRFGTLFDELRPGFVVPGKVYIRRDSKLATGQSLFHLSLGSSSLNR